MKRLVSLLLVLLMMLLSPLTAFAEGDPNIDNGGGDMGGGTSQNSWTPGRDGVRVTVIRDSDNQAVTASIDFTNRPPTDIAVHFGKVSKIQYRNGTNLTPTTGVYSCIQPGNTMPIIISSQSQGESSLQAIKDYFCREGTIRDIADATGFDYDPLISGAYKILLEPIAYFKYEGIMYAMTATEAALFDQRASGGLRSKMVSLTHKNLPLAMFLETADLGFSAWTGSKTSSTTNENIIQYLGMGIIRFSEPDPEPPQETNVVYRTDTEVITSVTVSTGAQRTPENPASVTFSINSRTYTHGSIYIPEGNSQLAWVKWRTPKEPGTVTIQVSSNCSVSSSQIVAKIVDLNQNIPPDPQANDRNDSYTAPSVPQNANVTTLTWGEWDCWWHENWVWISDWEWCDHGDWGHYVDNGWWEDQGWYEYEWIPYSATLTVTGKIRPDEKAPTATASKMKAGYGLNMEVSAELRSTAPSGHITGAQNAVAYFPEFMYKNFWRLLDRIQTGYSSTFKFQVNKYSTYSQRVHFTPPWFPDGSYTTYTEVLDAWTPAGMLQINRPDSLTITDSLFSDWHVRPIK